MAQHTDIQNLTSLEIESIQSPSKMIPHPTMTHPRESSKETLKVTSDRSSKPKIRKVIPKQDFEKSSSEQRFYPKLA